MAGKNTARADSDFRSTACSFCLTLTFSLLDEGDCYGSAYGGNEQITCHLMHSSFHDQTFWILTALHGRKYIKYQQGRQQKHKCQRCWFLFRDSLWKAEEHWAKPVITRLWIYCFPEEREVMDLQAPNRDGRVVVCLRSYFLKFKGPDWSTEPAVPPGESHRPLCPWDAPLSHSETHPSKWPLSKEMALWFPYSIKLETGPSPYLSLTPRPLSQSILLPQDF